MVFLTTQIEPDASLAPAWERHPYLATALLMALTTGACWWLRGSLSPTNLVMFYLLAVVAAALFLGYWPSVIAATTSVPLFAWFFVPPIFAFANKDKEYLVTFTALLAVGLLITDLVRRLRERTEILEELLDHARHTEALAADSRERLQLALEGAELGLWDWNLESGQVLYDRRWLAMLGFGDDELPPTRAAWEELVHPDDLPTLQAAWQAHLAGRSPSCAVEKRMRTKEGDWKWVYCTGRVVERDADGRPRRGVGTHLDIDERKRAADRIGYMAHHDALTGLANRGLVEALLDQRVAQAQRDRETLAVLFLDLDGFKAVNDALGHHAGDRYLEAIAQTLRDNLRAGDVLGRWGGDEFVAVLGGVHGAGEAVQVAEKLRVSLCRPIQVDGRAVSLGCSVGLAFFPDHGKSAEDLIRAADVAMYHAKQQGRDRCAQFSPQMTAAASQRLELEAGLRRALDQGEFELYYQPQLDLASGALAGVEALIRWRAPGRGLLAPASFIPVAEDSGLIVPIGNWVLAEAWRQAQAWQEAGLPALRVAVNVSAVQFAHPEFLPRLAALAARTPEGPKGLELELTETVLLRDTEKAARTLEVLRGYGYSVALDDFGTGYSSLYYLSRLPLDHVKIDYSFVRDLGRDARALAVVRAMLVLGHSVGARVLAEGVETPAQLEILRELGCDLVQGFHLARPMPATEFQGWVAGRAEAG